MVYPLQSGQNFYLKQNRMRVWWSMNRMIHGKLLERKKIIPFDVWKQWLWLRLNLVFSWSKSKKIVPMLDIGWLSTMILCRLESAWQCPTIFCKSHWNCHLLVLLDVLSTSTIFCSPEAAGLLRFTHMQMLLVFHSIGMNTSRIALSNG